MPISYQGSILLFCRHWWVLLSLRYVAHKWKGLVKELVRKHFETVFFFFFKWLRKDCFKNEFGLFHSCGSSISLFFYFCYRDKILNINFQNKVTR